MACTGLQPVAIFSAEAVTQAEALIPTGATGVATGKRLFDGLLITKDNADQDTGPLVLSR